MSDYTNGFNMEREYEKYGFLLKKSEQNKWQNKFCVLKDNFLFWYKEDEAVKMKRSKYFNSKPQGIIYLNDSIIREYADNSQSFCFVIENSAFQKPMVFVTDSKISCDTWIDKLTFNSNINYHNMLETQRFIKDLMDTSSSLKYTKVKRLFDDAKYENENLLKLKEELEKENEEKQKCLLDLQMEFSKIKNEVDEAYQIMDNLHNSKSLLEEKNLELENDLKKLDQERMMTSQLLNSTTSKECEVEQLQKKLMEISHLKEKIDQDKEEIMNKLSEKENLSAFLEQENQQIITQAQELNNLINVLKNDKMDIERKFEIERAARIDAENRLRDANLSLERLHCSIVEGGTKYSDEKKVEMTTDVNKLKGFFEDVIRVQSQPVPKKTRLLKPQCSNPTEDTFEDEKSEKNITLRRSCTADSIRIQKQSQRLREEYRQRISIINLKE